jgi:hypothetical protein
MLLNRNRTTRDRRYLHDESVTDHSELISRWRRELEVLRRHGSTQAIATKESDISDLEGADRQYADELLPLHDAAREAGRSADHLGLLVRKGFIANSGRDGAPLIKRSHLIAWLALKGRRAVPQHRAGNADQDPAASLLDS